MRQRVSIEPLTKPQKCKTNFNKIKSNQIRQALHAAPDWENKNQFNSRHVVIIHKLVNWRRNPSTELFYAEVEKLQCFAARIREAPTTCQKCI